MAETLRGRAQYFVHWEAADYPDMSSQVEMGVTAILTTSDILALQVLLELAQLGIRCPQDMSIIGFDNLPFGTAVRPELTTIAPNIPKISRHAVNYLKFSIENQPVTAECIAMENPVYQ